VPQSRGSNAQKKAAEASVQKHALALGVTREKIVTPIVPFTSFTRAEDYHQKYRLQGNKQIAAELRRYYPRFEDFVDSTAAARLNGYLSGHGSKAQLATEIDNLGLSEAGKTILLARR
jgi:peptide-methionine (S)-S-oxide reductase